MRIGPGSRRSDYVIALLFAVLATAVTIVLRRYIDPPPYALFYASVAVVAFIGGPGPALATAFLAALLIDLFIAPPLFSLWMSGTDLLRVISFIAVAGIIGGITVQRRRAEVSLVESESRFRTMADSAPVLIWTSGTDKLCNFFNRTWLRFTGRTMEQELGNGWTEAVHPDDFDHCLKVYAESFDARREFDVEYRLRRHDGQYRWLLNRGVPRFSLQGEFEGYIGSCIDITERKAAAQAAAEREARLTAILDAAVDGIITISEQGIMESANPAAERIFGYSREELIGRNVKMLMPSPDREQHDQYLRNYLATGQPKIIGTGREVIGLRKDGSTFPMDLAVSDVRFDGRRMFTGIVRDISLSRLAEQKLRHSEERFRLLFENSPIGVAIARQSKILFANPALVAMFGLERQEDIIGQSLGELVAPEIREEVWQRNLKRERGESETTEYESIGVRKDGSRFPFFLQARRIDLPDGPASIGFLLDITRRRHAEEALQQREREFKALVENAPDIITRFDRQYRHLYVNPAIERATGMPPTHFIGKTNRELGMDPELCDLWERHYDQAFNERREVSFDFSFPTASGLRHYNARLVPEISADGSVESIMGITRDTTARVQAEEALRFSEQRFRNIIEQSPLSIQVISPDGYTIAANRAWEQLWGTTRDKLQGYNMLEDKLLEARGVLSDIRRAFAGEYVHIPPLLYDPAENNLPGRPRWVEAFYYSTKDEYGQVREVVVMLQDVTERKRIEQERSDLLAREQALRQEAEASQRRSAFLAEASEVLVSSLDYDATLASVARLALPGFADACAIDLLEEEQGLRQVALVHVDPELEKFGHELRRRYPPDARRPGPIHDALSSGRAELGPEVDETLLKVATRDSDHLEAIRRFQIRSFIVAPLLARGRTFGVITFITSHTSGRRYGHADLMLAEELARRAALAVDNARLYTEAQRANRVKDEFLATLSHELRTPLNAILGWSQLLRMGRLDQNEVDQGLETIERNANIQSQLIEDLLDVSRIITGRLRLDVRPVELPPIIDAAIAAVRPAADAKHIRLKPKYDASAAPILGDAARLQQVVWNLLSNAIKFTPRGGRVEVMLDRVDSQVEITVRDTGSGIDPDFLPHVFERFRQADASTTRKHGGLGLGLAIVRHLVELHGGVVQARSEGQGAGATFIVRLPIAAVHDEEQRASPDAAATTTDFASLRRAPSLAGLRVLVVDDELDARRLISTVLRQCGADVIAASSAAEALDLLARQRPDVLISDIGMPGEDGYSLIRRLRASENHDQRLPAVALTAYARTEDRLRALAAGFQMHVSKPVNPAELATVVGSLAGRTADE
jgi:PAS domain S-box-containing protein